MQVVLTPLTYNDKVSLTPMTVYDDRVYPELIEQPRLRNQLNRDALQATEMPIFNGILRSQGGLMLNQGSGQMPTGISLCGTGGGQGMITLNGVPLFNNFGLHFTSKPVPAADVAELLRAQHKKG